LSLVEVLWQIESGLIHHHDRKIAVMLADDRDGLLRQPTTCNQMKSIFGADRRRAFLENRESLRNETRRNSTEEREKRKYNPTIHPPSFPVAARLIQLANINYTDSAVASGLSEHFLALVSKGLDPIWIPSDKEHDGFGLFVYTHWLATEGNALRSEQYTYDVARRAVSFYTEYVNRLIDISPRRLSMIARIIRDNPDPGQCALRLDQMLRPDDQRPKLHLPESWIPVLLWPDNPPRRPDPASPPEPPPAASQPDPEPEPDPPAPPPILLLPAPKPETSPLELTFEQGVRAVYAWGDDVTCLRVANILDRVPLETWDTDQLQEMARALQGAAAWQMDHVQSIAHTFAHHTDGTQMFCTSDEVLIWTGPEIGLEIHRWDTVRERMAPHIEKERQQAGAHFRDERAAALLAKKLPAQRKLKVVKERIDEIVALKAGYFDDQQTIDYIGQMFRDAGRFAKCETLAQYLNAVRAELKGRA
jgi:hypothetical protein